MTWKEFRDKVDAEIKKQGLDDVEICWIDISENTIGTAGIYVGIDEDGGMAIS